MGLYEGFSAACYFAWQLPYFRHFTLYTCNSTLYTLHSSLYTPHVTLHFTPYTPHSALYSLRFTLHNPHFTLYTPHFTPHTLHSTLYTLHFTRHTLHFTPHTLHSTLFTLHFTLHTSCLTLCTPHHPTLYTTMTSGVRYHTCEHSGSWAASSGTAKGCNHLQNPVATFSSRPTILLEIENHETCLGLKALTLPEPHEEPSGNKAGLCFSACGTRDVSLGAFAMNM